MITHSGSVTDQGVNNYAGILLPFVRGVAEKLRPSFLGTHIGAVGFGKTKHAIMLYQYASAKS